MARKGHTGTSMGGGIVGRKQLKAQHKPELPPVNPAELTPEARARRDAYEQQQRERAEVTAQRAAAEVARHQRLDDDLARRGLSARPAAEAVRRNAVRADDDMQAGRPPRVQPPQAPGRKPLSERGAPVVKWKNTARENGL